MAFDKLTTKIEYSLDQGTTYVDLDHIRQDGTSDDGEAQSSETSAGIELYAGTIDKFTVMVPDQSKHAALATAMKDDTQQGDIYLRFTDAEGNTEVRQGYSVIVRKQQNFTPGNRNAFMARFRRFFV